MQFSLLKTVFSDDIFLRNFTKNQLPVSVYEKLPPCFRISENKGGLFHKGGVFPRNTCDTEIRESVSKILDFYFKQYYKQYYNARTAF